MTSAHNRSVRAMLILAACRPSSAMIHFGAVRPARMHAAARDGRCGDAALLQGVQ